MYLAIFNNVGLVRIDCIETSCHVLTQNELFRVGVDVGIHTVSAVIYKAIKWNCQLHGNKSSLVRNVVRNATFSFPVIIIHSKVPAPWHMAWQHYSTVVRS